MIDQPLISVIIPVYNVEKYLPQCIESIINQTYSKLEIILVNDGSKDNSAKICDEYVTNFDDIKVIHKENEGAGIARNVGLENSSGEYVYFVDSDDWIEHNLLEIVLSSQEGVTNDILIFGYKKQYKNNSIEKIIVPNQLAIEDVTSNKFELAKILNSGSGLAVWDKLIRRTLILDNEILFDSKKRGQDFTFVIKCLSAAKRVRSIRKALYNYRIIYNVLSKFDENIIKNHITNFELLLSLFKRNVEKKESEFDFYLSNIFVLWFTIVIPINIVSNKKISLKEKIQYFEELLINSRLVKYSNILDFSKLTFKKKIIFYIYKNSGKYTLFLLSRILVFLRTKLNFSN